jgi:hypothetical protein
MTNHIISCVCIFLDLLRSFFKPLPQTAAGIKRKATGGGKAATGKGAKAAKGGKPRR